MTMLSILRRPPRGWTFIEVLTVIIIMGVLAEAISVGFPYIRGRVDDVRRIHSLTEMQRVIELYKADTGGYPPATSPPLGSYDAYVTDNDAFATYLQGLPGATVLVTANYIPNIAPTYYDMLPQDPKPGASTDPNCVALGGYNRAIAYITDGTNYKLIMNCADEYGISSADQFADQIRCLGDGSCWAWSVSNNTQITFAW